MIFTYCTVAGITFAIILDAFLKDHEASKVDAAAWRFIALSTLLWPITLPFILSSKLRAAKKRHQARYAQATLAAVTSES